MDVNTSVDNSIAFEASKVDANDRTNKELEDQASSFSELLNQTQRTSEISYRTTSTDEDSLTTTFEDPTNGKMVAVSLNKDTISKLEDYFGQNDIRRNQDGTVTLDNKAEAYVAGWFEDIAYNRGFLDADVNNDGQLSREEYNQTRNNFEANLKVTVTKSDSIFVDVEESVGKSYINARESDDFTSLYRSGNRAKSLDDELNMTLSIDKNFDSKVDMGEAYSTNKNMTKEELLLAHVNSLNIEDVVRSKVSQDAENERTDLSGSFNDILSIIVALLLNSEDEKTKQTLEKLEENEGDASSLDPIEKQIIEDILKLKPQDDGKYKMEDIEKVKEIFEKYEIKGDPLEEEKETLETTTDRVIV